MAYQCVINAYDWYVYVRYLGKKELTHEEAVKRVVKDLEDQGQPTDFFLEWANKKNGTTNQTAGKKEE